MENTFSAIVLASGLSERMGTPKAFLKWNKSVTFIEKIINEFTEAGCNRIVCMINERTDTFCRQLYVPGNVEFIVNHHPDRGRLYSVRTGLSHVYGSDFCFIHNVDNPFVSAGTIEKIYAARDKNAWCSPVYQDRGGHPVLIPEHIIRKINEIEDLNSTLSDVLSLFQKVMVQTDNDFVLRNINSPEDYKRYFEAGY